MSGGLLEQIWFYLGVVSQISDKSLNLEKRIAVFFLETSLVHLGTSPDTIGKLP